MQVSIKPTVSLSTHEDRKATLYMPREVITEDMNLLPTAESQSIKPQASKGAEVNFIYLR